MCVSPSGQCWDQGAGLSWVVFYTLVQFSKSLLCCLALFPHMCGQSESQWSYTNLWDQFPEYFPLSGLPCTFQFFGDNSYQSLGQKVKDFTYLSLPYILMTVPTLWPRGDRTKREQKHEGLTCSLEIKAPTIREEVSPSRRFQGSAVLGAAAVEASRFFLIPWSPVMGFFWGYPSPH